MAKIKTTAIIAGISGSLAGTVFATNRGGAYMRTKTTPSNPQSAAQSAVRAIWSLVSKNWKALSEANRKAWSGVVDQYKSTDVFGDLKTPSGSNLFQKINVNLSTIGAPNLDLPAVPAGVEAPAVVELTADSGLGIMAVQLADDLVSASAGLFIESIGGVSPGKNNVKNLFRGVYTNIGAINAGVDISAEQIARFGNIVAGQRYAVRVSYINSLTGERTPPQVVTAIAS